MLTRINFGRICLLFDYYLKLQKDFMKYKYIPNMLSFLRILMVPVFIYAFFFNYPNNLFAALAVFLLAGLTDIIDGYLARRYNWITNLGKLIDPLADKLMQSAALICLWVKKIVPFWLVAIFLLKELFMIGGALLVLKKIKFTVRSHWYGKMTTAVFYVVIVTIIIFQRAALRGAETINLLCIVPLICAIFSLIMYIADVLRINSRLKTKEGEGK